MGTIIEMAFIIIFIMLFVPFAMLISIKFFRQYIEWLVDIFDIFDI